MLDVMPEAILIFDPKSKMLQFVNAEIQRLINLYGSFL